MAKFLLWIKAKTKIIKQFVLSFSTESNYNCQIVTTIYAVLHICITLYSLECVYHIFSFDLPNERCGTVFLTWLMENCSLGKSMTEPAWSVTATKGRSSDFTTRLLRHDSSLWPTARPEYRHEEPRNTCALLDMVSIYANWHKRHRKPDHSVSICPKMSVWCAGGGGGRVAVRNGSRQRWSDEWLLFPFNT